MCTSGGLVVPHRGRHQYSGPGARLRLMRMKNTTETLEDREVSERKGEGEEIGEDGGQIAWGLVVQGENTWGFIPSERRNHWRVLSREVT